MKKSARLFASCGRGPKIHQRKLNGNLDCTQSYGSHQKASRFRPIPPYAYVNENKTEYANRDLADRFNISLCSSLFTSWSKAAAMVVFMPDQGRINETKPRFYDVKNLNCLIDC